MANGLGDGNALMEEMVAMSRYLQKAQRQNDGGGDYADDGATHKI